MRRRRTVSTTLAALAALALPLGLTPGAAAQPDGAGPDDLTPTDVTGLVVEAVREAQQERTGTASARSAGPATTPTDRELRRALDEATRALVDQGAVGVTARVESPVLDWRGSAGVREVGARPPAQPQDRFRVASITKTMIATLVLQEVEAGTFDLDTPVSSIVPGLFPGRGSVTVEQLLSHRSGAPTATDHVLLTRIQDPSSWDQFLAAIGQDYSDEDHLWVVNNLPWHFLPGTDFSYSNAGYVALGVLLQEVTGEEIDDLLRERVLRPAGMRHTSYPDDPGINGPFLVGAAYTGPAWTGGLDWVSLDGFDPDVFRSAGAAVSTTEDLNAFTEALLSGELLEPGTVADMVEPRTVGQELFPDYGLGVYRLQDPCTGGWLYGHDGASYGTVSLALSSADGTRQLSVGITGRDLTGTLPPYDLNQLLVPMLLATC